MRYVRFAHAEGEGWGRLEGGSVIELSAAAYCGGTATGREYALGEVRLLAPLLPSKVVCVGLNYRDHAEELNMPLPEEPTLFLKPPSAVIGPGQAIEYPAMSRQVDYEAELAVVIGHRLRGADEHEAAEAIFGYCCANDVTARDLQRRDGQWTRAKSFDTFCPLGPWIETAVRADDLAIRAVVNGNVRQSSRTSMMVWSPSQLVSFVSRIMTLLPGDVILTGTPYGVGQLYPGDEVIVEIEGIGRLRNRVEPAR
ncbi:MAG: fumarylacetoacetate hydrolase family protein [Syntrophomonadaceae bacterium]|nr:fumarylacetoacetate hydrolase family protein [Syntrophomonadaceae bacterium]